MAELEVCAVELEGVIVICDLLEGHSGDHAALVTWLPDGTTYHHNHYDCPPDCPHCDLMRLYARAFMDRISSERSRRHAFDLGVTDGLPDE